MFDTNDSRRIEALRNVRKDDLPPHVLALAPKVTTIVRKNNPPFEELEKMTLLECLNDDAKFQAHVQFHTEFVVKEYNSLMHSYIRVIARKVHPTLKTWLELVRETKTIVRANIITHLQRMFNGRPDALHRLQYLIKTTRSELDTQKAMLTYYYQQKIKAAPDLFTGLNNEREAEMFAMSRQQCTLQGWASEASMSATKKEGLRYRKEDGFVRDLWTGINSSYKEFDENHERAGIECSAAMLPLAKQDPPQPQHAQKRSHAGHASPSQTPHYGQYASALVHGPIPETSPDAHRAKRPRLNESAAAQEKQQDISTPAALTQGNKASSTIPRLLPPAQIVNRIQSDSVEPSKSAGPGSDAVMTTAAECAKTNGLFPQQAVNSEKTSVSSQVAEVAEEVAGRHAEVNRVLTPNEVTSLGSNIVQLSTETVPATAKSDSPEESSSAKETSSSQKLASTQTSSEPIDNATGSPRLNEEPITSQVENESEPTNDDVQSSPALSTAVPNLFEDFADQVQKAAQTMIGSTHANTIVPGQIFAPEASSPLADETDVTPQALLESAHEQNPGALSSQIMNDAAEAQTVSAFANETDVLLPDASVPQPPVREEASSEQPHASVADSVLAADATFEPSPLMNQQQQVFEDVDLQSLTTTQLEQEMFAQSSLSPIAFGGPERLRDNAPSFDEVEARENGLDLRVEGNDSIALATASDASSDLSSLPPISPTPTAPARPSSPTASSKPFKEGNPGTKCHHCTNSKSNCDLQRPCQFCPRYGKYCYDHKPSKEQKRYARETQGPYSNAHKAKMKAEREAAANAAATATNATTATANRSVVATAAVDDPQATASAPAQGDTPAPGSTTKETKPKAETESEVNVAADASVLKSKDGAESTQLVSAEAAADATPTANPAASEPAQAKKLVRFTIGPPAMSMISPRPDPVTSLPEKTAVIAKRTRAGEKKAAEEQAEREKERIARDGLGLRGRNVEKKKVAGK
jgi:hypothetical protein